MAATAVFGGLVMKPETIRTILRSDIMQESAFYQDILQEGLQKGRQEGRQEGQVALLLRLLVKRFGLVSEAIESRLHQATIADLRQQLNRQFAIRIGISNGPVVAGVIGIKKFIYDLWGDTVNVASRMESSGMPDRIQVTQSFRDLVSQSYHFEERGLVEIKGKGTMKTYWLLERTQPNLPASLLRDLEEYLPTESHDLKPNRWMI